MKRFEKFVFPLMVFAAIVAVWAFFRRGNAPVIVQGSGGVNFPQIAPLQQTLYTSPSEPADYTSPTHTAAAGAATSPAVYAAAVSNPLSGLLGSVPQTAPAYLTYNIPPSSDLYKMALAGSAGDAAAGSGSCGCGCGNTKSPAGCNSKPAAPRLPDGSGTCIGARNPKGSPKVLGRLNMNIGGYAQATGPNAFTPPVAPAGPPVGYVRSSEYGLD